MVDVRLPRLLKELFEIVLRIVKLSFLTGVVDNIRDTNRNTSGLNSIRFSPEGFLEEDGILRALVVHKGFSFKILKYF